ncbi:MAG TPA: GNAT family protein [Anaerolineales bacterium]|nr:GNAT family protein [Anaerolineales bacterium]
MNEIYSGKLVRLSALDPEELSRALPRWNRNSEYYRLLSSSTGPMRSSKAIAKMIDEELVEITSANYYFSIRTLADDKLIGDLGLDVVDWSGRDAFVGLGIGEPEYWGKGYGTDIMNILLRFAFTEINLRRVTLTVFEYNPRAIRSYEKAGFCHEGRLRKVINKEGRRWDILYMGILREEWMQQNEYALNAVPREAPSIAGGIG